MIKLLKLAWIASILLSCRQEPVIAQSVDEKPEITYTQKLSDYMDELERSGFSGSILVAQKGKILLEKGYGFSDREQKIKATAQTVFDIGSITKQFTGAAILKLEMQGKLSVKDKLSKYIPEMPADKKDITLHHLLTHSSGLPPAIGDDYQKITTTEFIKKAAGRKLLFKPGTQYEYSNVGFTFLGIIIEKVSGVSYETYLAKNLWKPSGMDQTGYDLPKFKDIAVGYRRNKTWGKPTEKEWDGKEPYWHLKANGGVLSTVQDMYKWHQALLGDKILNTAAKKKFYNKHIEEGEGAGSYYGYGWAIFPTPRKTELIAHNGGNGVFFADFWRYLEEDITIILMTNAVQRKYERIPSQVAGILLTLDFRPEISDRDKRNNITGTMADQLVKDFMQTVRTTDKDIWKSFLERRTLTSFLQSFPMEEHLNFFNQFHKKLKDGKVVEIRLTEGDEIALGIETSEGVQMIMFNVILASDGLVKIDGIEM
ncbi:serine hydrolase domain-containing protein [Aquimarina sp. 2201CG5-10]|uniref:serine hydrolase domain-containing protein n=1 Tax=Aquimarina callyspongiae TaxID=3098150 RepID=UPI002AB46FEA|nr:serine hydrolase domain-containing protein [Aquimarina sp. 2201CG5-10]MDY8137348.1 serine hydrolase domain-containing protein [Aquimarina sp. 2201CG5-10]